jgi:hypothetical protein
MPVKATTVGDYQWSHYQSRQGVDAGVGVSEIRSDRFRKNQRSIEVGKFLLQDALIGRIRYVPLTAIAVFGKGCIWEKVLDKGSECLERHLDLLGTIGSLTRYLCPCRLKSKRINAPSLCPGFIGLYRCIHLRGKKRFAERHMYSSRLLAPRKQTLRTEQRPERARAVPSAADSRLSSTGWVEV